MEKLNNNNDSFEIIVKRVDEPIKNTLLKEFIYTTISLSNITLDKKDYIAYFYNSKIKSYEIIIYKNKNHPFLLMNDYFYKNAVKVPKVILYKNLFLFFNNEKLFHIQKMEYELSKEEIAEFIFSKYFIKVDNFEFLDDEKIDKKNNDRKYLYRNLNITRKNNYKHSLTYFTYFLLIILLISFYIYKNNFSKEKFDNRLELSKSKLSTLIASRQKKLEVESLVDILKSINKYSLDLVELTYESKNYSLILENKDEKRLYKFINHYKKRVDFQKLQYIKERSIYELYIQLPKY